MEAPVVLKEGMEKTAAQQLLESLTAIQALCLIEPMDGSYVEVEDHRGLPTAPAEPSSEQIRKRDQLQFRVWSVVVVAAVVILVGFGLIAYLGTYIKLQRGETSTTSPAADSKSEESTTRESDTNGSYYALQNRIDELEEQLERLQTEAKELQTEINRTAGMHVVDPLELRKQQQTLHGLRAEIAPIQNELRALKSKRAEMGAHP
jgi:uncharacterized protein YlxW (UPF0749 family)